jgi:hypothetical protein
VGLGGRGGDRERIGDLRVCHALRNQAGYPL